MSVAKHLGINLSEYDRRIRTFIPHYEEMLDVVAGTVRLTRTRAPVIVDLGIGTGALAARCLAARPHARLVGLDTDADILAAARKRLGRSNHRVQLVHGSFERTRLLRCDAIVATLALHHIRSARAKRRLYQTCFRTLRAGGVLSTGDAFLADDPRVTTSFMSRWIEHMSRSYTPRQARAFLRSWAREDLYFSLGDEIGMLRSAGFDVEVLWRRPPFGVLLGRKHRQ
jgi:ubiquinone/menaquinone biosynthesis C-methylase UbiE